MDRTIQGVRKGQSCCVPLGFAFRHENASCVPCVTTKPWAVDGKLQPPPPRLLLDGQLVWTVNRILDHREGQRKNLTEFLIRWVGYDKANDSWEPEANIDPKLVQDYWDYVASCEQHTHEQAKQTG